MKNNFSKTENKRINVLSPFCFILSTFQMTKKFLSSNSKKNIKLLLSIYSDSATPGCRSDPLSIFFVLFPFSMRLLLRLLQIVCVQAKLLIFEV